MKKLLTQFSNKFFHSVQSISELRHLANKGFIGNIHFVNKSGNVVLATTDAELAQNYWRTLAKYEPNTYPLWRDFLTGTLGYVEFNGSEYEVTDLTK